MTVQTFTNAIINPAAANTINWNSIAGTGGVAGISNLTTGGPGQAGWSNVTTFNRVTWSTATTAVSGGITTDSGTGPAFTAGNVYTHMYVRSSKAQTVAMTAQLYNGATATTSATSTAVALPANTWTRVTVTVAAASTDNRVVLTVAATTGGSNWAAGDKLDGTAADGVRGFLGPYFDGNSTAASSQVFAWTGTANLSSSTNTTYTPALAVTPATTAPCPRFDITLTDLPPLDQTVNVWRTTGGVRTAVRGARSATANSSQNWTDYEAPIGQPVQYDIEITAGISTGTTATATGTITAPTDAAGKPLWWVQDPLVPGSAIALAVTRGDSTRPYLTAAAVKNLEYAADISIIPVMGSTAPVAIGGQRLAAAGVSFSMVTNAAEATTNLRNLLAQAAVVLVRPPGDRNDGVPATAYTAIPRAVEKPVTVAFGGTLTHWELTGNVVAAPLANVLVPIWTYGNVTVLWATYQQAQTAYTAHTYLDAQKNPANS